VDQRFAGKIRVGQSATVILRARGNAQIPGRVYRIRPQADPAAEEMTVEISFPLSTAELQIGQWADVYVQVGEMKKALVVPKPAIMPMGNDRFVLVAGPDNRVRRVKIEPLASSPRSPVMAVVGDLKPGDQVLTSPMGIRPGQKVCIAQSAGAMPSGSGAARASMP
jgi:multidrug efflux pump subunit AcrA (membrane-fusion protein)